jgi:hypothetical protein
MSLISKDDLNRIIGQSYNVSIGKAFDSALDESARYAQADSTKTYDVFLSHSYLDKETVLQVSTPLV